MQPRGRFVEDVKRPAGGAFGQFLGQFHALRLAARKRRRLLAHLDVAEAHADQRVHLFADGGDRLEEFLRILDRHVEHVGDRLALELHLERFAVVAGALAGFAGDIDVGQEMHLDLDHAVALAGLAPAALDVEGKAPRLVAAGLGLGQPREPVADRREGTGIGGGVRPGRAPDGPLVDVDDLVEMFQPPDRFAGRGRLACAVQLHRGRLEQGLDGQRGFTPARHAGDANEFAQRKIDGDVLQVVAGGLDHRQLFLVARTPFPRHRDLARSGEVLPGDRGRVGGDFGGRPPGHDLAAMHARARADIEDVIGLADRFLVMFDDDDGIALVAQVFQRGQQPVIVALVEADGRFVENIEHPGQARPDLRGQPDALRFTARQCPRVAGKRQVFQPHIVEEPKPFTDFLQDRARDLVLLVAQRRGHRFAPVESLADRHLDHLPDMQTGDLHRQRLGPQTVTPAGAAGPVVLITFEFLADPGAVGFAVPAFHVGDHALEAARDLVDTAAFIVAEGDFLVARAAQKHLLDLFGQVFPRLFRVELVMLGDRLDRLDEIGRLALAPGRDGPVFEAEGGIRHHQAFVEEQLHPQTVAGRAGAERCVEGKQARLDLGDREARDRAGEVFTEGDAFGVALAVFRCRFQNRDAIGQIQRGAETVGQPRLGAFAHDDPVHHHVDVVAEFLVEHRRVVEVVEFSVHLDPLKPLLAQFQEFLAVFPFAVTDDRGEQIGARPLLHRHHAVDHVLHLLRLDGLAGGGRIGRADPREEQAHVIVDLGHGADGRTGVFRRRLLFDGNRGAEARDVIDVRFFHHVEELPRIGAERFHVAALPLGINRVEGEAGFARPGQAGDHDQLIAGDIDIDILEVVLARAAHLDLLLLRHRPPPLTDPQHIGGTG